MDASKRLAREKRHQLLARLVGEAIRFERHRQNLSQEKLADAAEMSVEALGRIERGEAVVTYPRLLDIFYALDLSEAACVALLRQDSEGRRAAA